MGAVKKQNRKKGVLKQSQKIMSYKQKGRINKWIKCWFFEEKVIKYRIHQLINQTKEQSINLQNKKWH